METNNNIQDQNDKFQSPEYKRSRGVYMAQCTFEYLLSLLVTDAFLTKLLSHLGLDDTTIGIISSFITLAFVIQIFSLFLYKLKMKSKTVTLIFYSISRKGFDCYYEGDVEQAVHDAMYRGGKSYDVFKNVLVENCVIWNDWGKALEIGAETRAEEICDVCFRNCDLIHLTGAALDCMNVDYADVHDVTYEDIRIEADEVIPKAMLQKKDSDVYVNTDPEYMPTTMSAKVQFHYEYSAGGDRRGKNRNLTFRNIRLYGKHPPKARFEGYDETHKTENVRISNLYWNDALVTELTGENWDVREYTDNIRLETCVFVHD